MKHLKLFFALFAMLALGVGNAWGAEIVFKTNTSDATSPLKTNTLTDQVSSGADYIASVGSDIARVYQGKSGLKFGNSSTGGVLTLNLAIDAQIANPTITIKSAKYNSKNSSFDIFVNGSSTANATATVGTDLTFTYTGTITTIQIKGKKPSGGDTRAYLSSINIEGNGGDEPSTPTKLTAPANLKEASITETSATLSWDAVANASNYSVTINGNNATANTNSYNATGLTAGTEYTWSVVAKGDGTNYTDSEAAQHTFTTTATTPDPEPGTGTSGEVTFAFDTDQGLSELGITKPNAGAGTNLGSNVYTKAPINMTATDGGTATRVWNSSGATTLRVYQPTGSLTFSSEATINKIVFNTSITATASVGTLSGTTWTGEAKEVKFTFTANATIKTINVAYTVPSSGGGSEEPVASLTADPTTIDFGTVYEGATVADKTVAVNFANLTGDVTYSGLSTPFTATGTISATGDKITISADASNIGEYSQTLTIASTADSKTAEVRVIMNVIEKPAPTGTFTLHTGALVEGDYVIVSTNSLKAEVNSERLASLPVTISNDEIVDPDATTIWHIAKSGEYWTLYNANKAKYAASTGAKNKAALLDDGSDDRALWSASGTSTYEFVNKKNTEAAVNANLRYNSQNAENSRWACYSTSTGAALSLYRKAGEKYDVTVNPTTNGAVTANPTSAEAGTTITLTVTPAGGYVLDALTVTDASSNPVTVTDNKFTMPASDVTVTATFKENEKPAATLTLSKNGVEEPFPGSWKQDDVVTLPSITSDCVKEFVGWSANPACNVAPEYAAGDSYTLEATAQTLYAVYATAGAGEILTITPSAVSGSADPYTFTIDVAGYSLTAKKNGGSNAPTYNDGKADARVYAQGTVTLTAPKALSQVVFNLSTQGLTRLAPITASVGTIATQASGDATVTWTGDATEVTFTVGDIAEFGSENTKAGQLCFGTITVTTAGSYSNYSTTCAAAPIATVNPTSVTATAADVEGKVTVTYENVNTENVAVALFNDAACTEAFTAGWLTAFIDADNNITYTVAKNTTYAERKAYIQLTAPETTGATDPDVVVIPVTQAGKDKVFASLAELVAADLTAGDEVTVTLNNDVIKEFYISSSKRCGVVFDVQKDGKDIKIYFNSQTTIDDWAVGGKLLGTLTNVKWTTYSSAWQLAPANTWAWANLTYTEPKAVSTVVVSGAPTKTTYVDGEAFDPAGLTVTVNYNDATTEVNPTGVTFAITPATLVKGQTSVSVTATYNSVTSAAYEVTGLTVNDIPNKTVAEFIAAGGTRCYLEGIVSGLTEGNSMKYGNFDLTDASGAIYVYGCLNASGEKEKFAELGVKNGDKIKVIADEYELYGGTKDEAKNVQYVSHVSAASITVENITMEVDEVATITATVDPVDAVVTYTIKENAANAISLSGKTITALAEGTATITATVAEGATYLGNSVDFTVTVGPKTESEEVVILAEHNGQWYALKAETGSSTNSLAALEVEYFNGVLYNVDEADKASITWKRTIVGNFETFQYGDKYLKGSSSTNLFMEDGTEGKYQWDKDTHTMLIGSTNRTFLYQGTYFKNYAISNAGRTVDGTTYSALPVVTAPVYATGTPVYTRTIASGDYGTICLPYASSSYSGAEFYEISWMELDEDGTTPKSIWLDQVNGNLVAGKPYIFKATSTVLTVNCTATAVANPVAGEAGLVGTFKDIKSDNTILEGNYMISGDQFLLCPAGCWLNANRAYIDASIIAGHTTKKAEIPGRRRVCLGETSENEATGFENIVAPEGQVLKVIENGQLIIIRNGEKYNVQGQRL